MKEEFKNSTMKQVNKFFGVNNKSSNKPKAQSKPVALAPAPAPVPVPVPPPAYNVPALTSANFPSSISSPSEQQGLFSHIYCNNYSSNEPFIRNNGKDFGASLKTYKTLTEPDENSCLTNCNNDKYCSSYVYNKLSKNNNCNLYNVIPITLNNNNSTNSGYKHKYNYNLSNLNSNQKNIVKNDCLNSYLNEQYNTTDKNYASCYTINNNEKIEFNGNCLWNSIFNGTKGETKNKSTYENNDLINSIGDNTIDDFTKEYTYYLQTQTNLLQSDNENHKERRDNRAEHEAKKRFDETKKYVNEVQKYNNVLLKNQIKHNDKTDLKRITIENFKNNDEIQYGKAIKNAGYLLLIIITVILAFIIYKNI